MNEEQHIERDQSPEREYLHGEEVGPCEHGPVGTDELLPRCCALSLRSRGNAAASEDIANRLVGQLMTEITQGADNAVVAPVAILSGHPYHQPLEFAFHSGTTGVTSLFGAIAFARDTQGPDTRSVL